MKLSLARPAGLVFALVLVPAVASAQEAPPPPPMPAPAPGTVTTQETTSQPTGPSMAMIASGLVVFGVAYVPAVVAGSTSKLDADRTLLVPLAGPWIDLAQRPGCSPASQCNAENTNKVLLVLDGIFQGAGALTVLGGLLTTVHETTTVQQTAEQPTPASGLTVRLLPASVGSGYGMVASGKF